MLVFEKSFALWALFFLCITLAVAGSYGASTTSATIATSASSVSGFASSSTTSRSSSSSGGYTSTTAMSSTSGGGGTSSTGNPPIPRRPCSSDSECYGRDGAICQTDGYCGCTAGLDICNTGGYNYYVCYNSTLNACCEGNPEEPGLLCKPGSACCGTNIVSPICYDPTTHYCCSDSSRTACAFDESCCQGGYGSVCTNNATQCCFCDGTPFSCPSSYTCSCSDYTGICIPPPSTCGGRCGPTDGCCNDAVLGQICYNNSTHDCVFTGSTRKYTLCAKGNEVCNGVCFDPAKSSCTRGIRLCPAGSEIDLCIDNTVCYNRTTNACIFSNNKEYLCGPNDFVCVDQCYDLTTYLCLGYIYDGEFVQVLCNRKDGICGTQCYDQSLYQCCDGVPKLQC